MIVHKCDRCKKIITEPPWHEVKVDGLFFDLCKECTKEVEDFIKYCKHGSSYSECKDCNTSSVDKKGGK